MDNTFCEKKKTTASYREVRIGNTIYRVTSVFTGEKDLGKTLEQLAVRRAMNEPVTSACRGLTLPAASLRGNGYWRYHVHRAILPHEV